MVLVLLRIYSPTTALLTLLIRTNELPGDSAGKATANGPKCKCNRPSLMLTVSRPGSNFGRTFYRCANGLVNQGTEHLDHCDFFEWSDAKIGDAAAAVAASAAAAGLPELNDDHNHIRCGCNKPAKMLRVSKSSTNIGRRFLKCPDGKCGFFAWVDL
jgi:hypothetical protein